MRVITWNCNMSFRKKAGFILAHRPDILVIQECEHPDRLKFAPGISIPTDTLWFGRNQHKGLAILSYGNYRLKLLDTHNPSLQLIVPVAVTGNGLEFTIYAIWAHNPDDPDGRYIEQVWKALKHYKKHLTNKQTMLIGDFNSNTIWDKKRRKSNHSNVVKHLEKKGIHSSYHLHFKQIQGKEAHPTFYLYRHQDKPYHLDYCFVSEDLAAMIQSIDIGPYDEWREHSDHTPVMITFNDLRE